MNLGGSIRVNKCAVISLIAFIVLLIYIFSPSQSSSLESVKSQQVNLRKLVIGLILATQAGGKEVLKISSEPDFGIKTKGKTKEGVDDPVRKRIIF